MNLPRVLILEDNLINAMTLEAIFSGHGYSVISKLVSAEDILAKIDELTPDLIIMDIMLEGTVNGLEAAEMIRWRHSTPIIFISALSDQPTRDRIADIPNCTSVSKPFGEHDILQAANQLM